MKRTIKTLLLLVLFGMCISLMSCKDDDNPLSAYSLAGTWNLVTITIKENNTTLNAGEPTEIEEGITMTITGSLVLTETRFTFTQLVTISISGFPPETDDMTSTGTYSISGSTLTIVEDDTGETSSSTISTSDNRLTIDDDEVTMVFEKQ